MKPRALDLFCGAGGASMGLHRAGFDVTGVDIAPQPNYPFKFVQSCALSLDLRGFAFVWASPPCQRHSRMSGCRDGLAQTYPDLIQPVREKLQKWGGPYIIENVVGAPLINPIMLCGTMFGLELYRHRLFESNCHIEAPFHPKHTIPASKAGHWKPGTIISVAGNCAPVWMARKAMGIDWTTRAELVEAIPPAFSEYLANQIFMKLDAQGCMLCEACGCKPAGLIFTRLTDDEYINLCPACRGQLLRKNILTETQQCVNLSSPARTGRNLNHTNNVNTKTLALISGVLATAFGQIQNILTGAEGSCCDKQPEAPKEKKASKKAPEPEEEEEEEDDTELVVETDEDETDYVALRKTMKSLVEAKVESNKEAVRAAMVKLGVKKVGDVPDDKLEAFIAALKKIK